MPAISCVIPARLESSRLPEKVLAEIGGQPMLWHVWQRATQVLAFQEVLVAVDSERLAERANAWGARTVVTSAHCSSGTERAATIAQALSAEWIVVLQADEPAIEPSVLEELCGRLATEPHPVATLVRRIETVEELFDPHLVKAVIASDGRALYFSRAPIPFSRDQDWQQAVDSFNYWGHVGLYAIRRDLLLRYPTLPRGPLEGIEQLEQLRFLESGVCIAAHPTNYRARGVDTPADLERMRRYFEEGSLAASSYCDSQPTPTSA